MGRVRLRVGPSRASLKKAVKCGAQSVFSLSAPSPVVKTATIAFNGPVPRPFVGLGEAGLGQSAEKLPNDLSRGGDYRGRNVEVLQEKREALKINSPKMGVRAQQHPASQQGRFRND